jgi:hypothetical protein
MRPESHIAGDKGINEVERIFLDAGWVINRVPSDYGEDLAVQPCIAGNVGKTRIYVQVKYVGKSRDTIRIKREQMFIWQFIKDPFLIVCWNAVEKRAVYIWANKSRVPQLFADFKQETFTLRLSQMRVLDAATLSPLSNRVRRPALLFRALFPKRPAPKPS